MFVDPLTLLLPPPPSLPPSLPQDQQEKDAKAKAAAGASGQGGPKRSPGEMRLAKDISELTLSPSISVDFPDGKDKLLDFIVTIRPEDGFYRGGVFRFSFAVPGTYPHEPPKVKCLAKVYHPNLDHDGNVCLNILREDWKPVLSVSSCVYGLTFLFSDPNPDDPLNKEAAKEMTESPRQFEQNVRRSMQGGYVGGDDVLERHAVTATAGETASHLIGTTTTNGQTAAANDSGIRHERTTTSHVHVKP